jgi:methyl coenzyme M reductase gamma subunit
MPPGECRKNANAKNSLLTEIVKAIEGSRTGSAFQFIRFAGSMSFESTAGKVSVKN